MDLAGGLRVDDLSKTDLFDFVCPDTPHQPFRLGLFTHQEELMEFSSSSNPAGGSNMSGSKDMANVNHGSSTGNTSFETVWLATPSPDEGYAGSTASGSAHAEEDMDVTAWTGSSNNNNNNNNCTSMLKSEGSANGYATSDAEHNLNNAALTVALLSCDVNWATARIDNNKHENESNSTADTATSSSASSGGTEPMDLDTLLQMVGFASTNNMSPVPTSCASQHPDSLFGESIAAFNSHNSNNNHDHSDPNEAHQKKEALVRSNSSRPQRLEPFASIHPQARRMKSDYGPAYHSPPPPLVPLSSIGKNYWVNPVSAAPTTTTSSISDLNPKMSLLRNALQGKPPQQQPLNSDINCGTTQQPSSKSHTELRKALSAPVGMANPYVISRQLSTQPATVSMFTRAVTSPLSTVIDPGTPPLTPVSSSALASPYNNGPSPESCLNSPTTPVSLSRQLGSNGHGSPAMTLAHETPNGTPIPNTTSDSSCPSRQFVLQFDNRSHTAMSGIKEEAQTLIELVSVDPMLSAGEVNMAAEFDFGVYASESVVKLEPGTQRLLMDDVEVGGITNIDDLLMCDIDDIDKLKTYQKEVAESLNQMYHAASRHQLQQSVLEAVLASNSNSNSFTIGPDSFGSADDASVPSSSSNGNPHQNNTASSTGIDNGPKLNGAPVRKKRISKKAKKLLQEQELASSTACSHGSEGNTAGSEENLSTSPGQTSSSTDSLEAKKERLLHYCSICSKGFKDKYSVNVHIRTHTGEKPFACPMCGKNFRQKAHLAKHQQTHSKVPGPSQAKSKR